MIPLKFGLFWSGTELSYLRFLTFVSLRKYHPKAKIELYLSKTTNKNVSWKIEKQDFQSDYKDSKNYINELKSLNVDIIEMDLFPTYSPNYQSDLFRWWWLYNNGGFYLDTDQIILKPFNDLPLHVDFIYSMYNAQSCGIYSPVGAIGAKKGCSIVKQIMYEMSSCYNSSDYNSLGPFMFRDLFFKNKDKWESENLTYNAPPNVFYPIPESYLVNKIYESKIYITGESYSLHWYGGSPKSQKFNNEFTEKYIGNNTIYELSNSLNNYWNKRKDI